ncbi:MAG: hypothetical protein SPL71_14590 [Oribacterium sp.]|nr:hypothetical protein [Oribacterium sp.]
MKTDKETRERLRKALPTIRLVLGWSAEHLAKLLDVSRVTIVNLENTENKMTTIQYLAIRALLQDEISTHNNEVLSKVLEVLVDRDDVPEDQRQSLCTKAIQASKKVGRKSGSAAIGEETVKAVLKSLGDMRLSDIPQRDIHRGQTILQDLLNKPVNTNKKG